MKTINISWPALLLVPCLLLTACTADQVAINLELAVDAALAAAPAVEAAAGVPPVTQAAVSGYLNLATACLSSAETVIGTKGISPAAASAQIAGACGSDALRNPSLPAGTPQNIVSAVGAVANALSIFLQSLPSPVAQYYFSRPAVVSAFQSSPGKIKVDRKRLKKIHAKLETLRSKLKTTKAAQ